MEQKILGDVSAHEAEGFIKPIQKLVLFNILMGLSFSAHGHPKQTKLVQGHLHIYPPINIVEGCKDSRYKS